MKGYYPMKKFKIIHTLLVFILAFLCISSTAFSIMSYNKSVNLETYSTEIAKATGLYIKKVDGKFCDRKENSYAYVEYLKNIYTELLTVYSDNNINIVANGENVFISVSDGGCVIKADGIYNIIGERVLAFD